MDRQVWHTRARLGASPLRFWLGMAQMFVSGTALLILVRTGVSDASLIAASVATVLTLTSRWLFRRR
jgi:hypothetical protein